MGTFENNDGGIINVDNTTESAIDNFSNGKFTNYACGKIFLYQKLNVESFSSFFNNEGLLYLNTSESHDISNKFTNNGVVVDIQGGFSGGTNNDLIIAPFTFACPFTDALQIGGANSFTVLDEWFHDTDLTDKAGNYDQPNNHFLPTNLSVGVNTLFFSATDGTCTYDVSVEITSSSAITPGSPTWTGAEGTDWGEACNWMPPSVPTAADDVIIPDVTNDPIIAGSTTAVAKSVEVETDAVLTINANGSLTISGSTGVGFTNEGQVDNSGTVKIDNTSSDALRNNETFNNKSGGQLWIGQVTGGIGRHGIHTNANATFNNSGGTIKIDETSNNAIDLKDSASGDFKFNNTNSGLIKIGQGAGNITGRGIFMSTRGAFLNEASIEIDQTGSRGIEINGEITFINMDALKIGQAGGSGSISGFGIYLSGGEESMNNSGTIDIDNTSLTAIESDQFSSKITNTGNINIGMGDGNIGRHGILLEAPNNRFINDGGVVNIKNVANKGLYMQTGQPTFTNKNNGNLEISNCGQEALDAILAATFINSVCSRVALHGKLNIAGDQYGNSGKVENNGSFIIETNLTHINEGNFINNGVLNTVFSPEVPNVTNNEIIIAETTEDCEVVNPAFQLGATVDYEVLGVFKDANATISAGTYDGNTNTFTPTDGDGSYTYFVKVKHGNDGCTETYKWNVSFGDSEDPVPQCNTKTVQLDANGSYILLEADVLTSALDNCGTVNFVSADPTTVDCDDVGQTISVLVTVNDGNENTGVCQAQITVEDDDNPCCEAPEAVCQSFDAILDAFGQVAISVSDIDNGSTADCGEQSKVIDLTSFDCGDIANNPTTVTLTITDINGDSDNCTAEVTVKDETIPSLTCPTNIDVTMDAGQCGATVTWATPNAADNCDGSFAATQTMGDPSGSFFAEGIQTIEYTATDAAGNSEKCSFTVTVQADAEKPSLACPTNIDVAMDVGQCGATITWATPNASDNCDGSFAATQTLGNASGSLFAEGTQTIEYTATDAAGNSETCFFTVTVQADTEEPTAVCQDISISPHGNGDYAVDASLIDDGSTDNCSVVLITVSPSTIPCFHESVEQTVTLTVTDASGNDGTCTATVTLLDDDDCDGVGNSCDLCPGGDDQVDEDGDGNPDCAVYPGWDFLLEEWGCPTGNGNNEKVLICHDGNTLCVSENSLASHLAHGDYIGSCGTASCAGQNLVAPTNGNSLQFDAVAMGGKTPQVDLYWTAGEGFRNGQFTVEKSLDGNHFEPVAEEEYYNGESGIQAYTSSDPNPEEGEWLYRLKGIGNNGSTTYSESKMVRIDMPDDYTLFPNPTKDRIQVSLKSSAGEPALLQIVNGQGVIVQERRFNELPISTLTFDLNGLKDGIYWLNVQVEGRKARVMKFIVAKQ